MTFLPKPERNNIWVFAHGQRAPDQPRRFFDREPWYTP